MHLPRLRPLLVLALLALVPIRVPQAAPSVAAEPVRPLQRPAPVAATPHAIRTGPALRVRLEALKTFKALAANPPGIGPMTVGLGRDLPPDLSQVIHLADLEWRTAGNGERHARIEMTSPGAKALRAALWVYALPDGVNLVFYAPGSTTPGIHVSAAAINRRLARDRAARDPDAPQPALYWSPVVAGETLGLEIRLPPGISFDQVRIAIPRLSHLFMDPATGEMDTTFGIGDSQSCTLDVSCFWDDVKDIAPAVARMIFTSNSGASALCTGTLVNDLDPHTQIPYFLTARHCISTQSAASTLNTFWFFRTLGCRQPPNPDVKMLGGGATLLAAVPGEDMTLLRLDETPPTGALFAGWDASPVPAKRYFTSVSHPAGDLQKVAFGSIKGDGSCYFVPDSPFLVCADSDGGRFLSVVFQKGMVEGGSSGSGMFLDTTHKLVGTLTGGSARCDLRGGDIFYGRFELAYNEAFFKWLGGTPACDLEPGSWRYCATPGCGPCAQGQGDCNADSDCQSGLVCAQDRGALYGFDPSVDVCEPPSGNGDGDCTLDPGAWDYCADPQCGPCAAGQGDCDSDSECQGDLVCLHDRGQDFGFPAAVDVCGDKPTGTCALTPGDWGYCSDPLCGPCAEGQGDCDSDAECAPGLVCAFNVGADYGLPASMDVCEKPKETVCTRSPGDWGFCSDPACGPCEPGQGDCDQDRDCASGLKCSPNVGEKYGLPPSMDVCE